MRSSWHPVRVILIFILGTVLFSSEGCSFVVEKDVKGKGIAASCTTNSDCHAGVCVGELCTSKCGNDADCPTGTKCQRDGFCAQPLRAGFLYIGVLADQGWSYMHDQGRRAAEEALPWLTTEFAPNVITDADVTRHATAMIEKGANVIIQSSQGGTAPMAALAEKYKKDGVTFLQLYNRTVTNPNLGSYWVKIQQSWYLAGYIAAKKAKKHRIAWIGGYVSPQGIVRANGFVRGARRADPNVQVEVRWVGFWFDPGNPVSGKYRETLLAEQVIEAGAEVVMSNTDNERVYDAVEAARVAGKEVWSIETNNPASCAKYPRSCLGVAWLNWAPIYIQQLSAIHKHKWKPEYIHRGISVDPSQSPVGFQLSTEPGMNDTDTRLELENLQAAIANDNDLPLRGPYATTGNRSAVADGEVISDDELLKMCWFPEGMVEKVNPDDPKSGDRPALVPHGERTFLKRENMTKGNESLADPPDCAKNQ
ncbi:BMP family ABC transporter substrate-binding protein [Pendulispora albinea]|uniref:BMP family ABC transporter substrate-binding protein n=1 Tax=Pendulispora albinea TaxID=2741071 RepID=A0ABZ2M610_9BACT